MKRPLFEEGPSFVTKPAFIECRTCASYGHASQTCWQRPKGEPREPHSSCDRWLANRHLAAILGLTEGR